MSLYSAPALCGPRVVVPPAPTEDQEFSSLFVDRMRFHFAQDARFEVVSQDEVSRIIKADPIRDDASEKRLKKVKQAKTLLKTGWKNFKQLNLDAAITDLEKAKVIFRNHLSETLDMKNLLTCHLHLGIAYIANKQKARGEQEIREMVILDPARKSRKLSEKYYSPDMIQIYESIRKSILESKLGDLELNVTPTSAFVWVNGQEIKGRLVKSLPEGEHFVAVQHEGFEKVFQTKYVVSGSNAVTINLRRLPSKAVSEYFKPSRSVYDLSQSAASYLDDLTVKLDADMILMFDVKYDANNSPALVEAQLLDQRSQETTTIIKEKLQENANVDDVAKVVVGNLSSQLNSQGYLTKKANSNSVRGQPSSQVGSLGSFGKNNKDQIGAKPWYKKWWPYAVIGGAAAIVGGVLIVSSSGDSSTSNIQITNPSQ